MLTLEEIQNISFRRSNFGGGYKLDDVDDFVDKVIETVKSLEKANKELENRVAEQDKELQEHKKKQESVQEALVTAQITAKQIAMEATQKSDEKLSEATQNAEKIVNDAKQEAEKLVSDAKKRADRINSEADSRVEELMNKAIRESHDQIEENNQIIEEQKKNVIRLMGEAHKFRNTLLKTYKEHLNLINEIAKGPDIKTRQKELDEEYPMREGNKPVELSPISMAEETVPEISDETSEEPLKEISEETAVQETPVETAEEDTAKVEKSEEAVDAEKESTDDEGVVFPEEGSIEQNKRQPVLSEKKYAPVPDVKPSILKFEDSDDQAEENTLTFKNVSTENNNNGNNRKKHGKKRR